MEHRYSKKREAILNAIRSTDTHPSADWVYEKLRGSFPDISLGTIYRNLAAFKNAGLIRSVSVVDGSERFDCRVYPHPHFICKKCGRVMDISTDPLSVVEVPDLGDGFTVDLVDVTYYGQCPDCSQD